MGKWLLRGIVFAALMLIVRLVQGAMINAWVARAGLISGVLVALFAVTAFVWGAIDGHAAARSYPNPDRRPDLAMTWLLAGLFAGIVSGILAWIIGLVYPNIYVGALVNEVTTFAAFTALVTFVAAVAGGALGRWLIDRHAPPVRRHGASASDDRAGTDVFAAVRNGEDQATPTPPPDQERPT